MKKFQPLILTVILAVLAISVISANLVPSSFASSTSTPVNVFVPGDYGNHGIVDVISSPTNIITKTIKVSGNNPLPGPSAYCSGKIFVSNLGTDTISVISPSTDAVIKTIKGFTSPGNLYCNGKLLWISDSDYTRVLNTTGYKIIAKIDNSPDSFGYSPKTGDMYVLGAGNVSLYNPTTFKFIKTIGTGISGSLFAYDPVSKDMYLTNGAGPFVTMMYIISPSNKILEMNYTGSCTQSYALIDVTYSPITKEMYATCIDYSSGEGALMILDATNGDLINTISNLGTTVSLLAYNPSNEDIYVLGGPANGMNATPVIDVLSSSNTLLTQIQDINSTSGLAIS